MVVNARFIQRALSGATLLLLLLVSGTAYADLRGWFLDVGQGDSALFVSPSGTVVLVDAGPSGSDDEIRAAMKHAGVKAIDLVVLTHGHVDHIGGLRALLKSVPVARVLDSGFVHPTRAYTKLMAELEAKGVPIETGRRGQSIDLGEGARLMVLAPREPFLTGTRSDPNSNSIIARLVYGEVAVMLTGDAEAPTEMRLLHDGGGLNATVLKVAHHGSEHATSRRFLDAVKPKAGVISCGRDNKYGHPAPELVERLQARRVPLYRTDLGGNIAFRTDGKRWAIQAQGIPAESQRSVEELAVAPDLSSGGLVNVNTATASELDTLPGIGPKKAAAIIATRGQRPFATIDDLARVRGIGPKTVERLRPLVTVGAAAPSSP